MPLPPNTGYQWCIAKNGGGYTQWGVAKGPKVPCLFMITEVSIRCQKKTRRLVYAVYPCIPPHYTTAGYATDSLCQFLISALRVAAKTESISSVDSRTPLHRLSSKFSTKSFTKGESGRSMPRSTTSIPLAGREDRRIPARPGK